MTMQPVAGRTRAIRSAGRIVDVTFWTAVAAIAMAWLHYVSWSIGGSIAAGLLLVAIVATIRKGMLMAIDKVEASHRGGPPEVATAPPSVFYRVNTNRVRFTELRGVARGRAGLAKAAALKVFRIRMPHLYMADPAAIELVPTVSAGSRLHIMLEASLRACRDAGLIEQFAYRVPQLTDVENLAVLFTTTDRRVLTVANATISTVGTITAAGLSLLCWSRLDEERRITTTTFGGLAPPPPWEEREVMRGHSIAEMTARHLERIARRDVLPFAAERTRIMNEFLRLNRQGTEYLIARKILEPMSAQEVAAVRTQLQAIT